MTFVTGLSTAQLVYSDHGTVFLEIRDIGIQVVFCDTCDSGVQRADVSFLVYSYVVVC